MGWCMWKFRLCLRAICGIIPTEGLSQTVYTHKREKSYLELDSSITRCEGLDPIRVSFSPSKDGGFELVLVVSLSSSLGSDSVRALSAAATEGGRANACFTASISSFFLLECKCRGGLGGAGALGSILKTAMGGGGSGPAFACSPG